MEVGPRAGPADGTRHNRGSVRPRDGATSESVSVVIVNYRGLHHLRRCIPSIVGTLPARGQIIVVDNCSDDGSVEWLQDSWPEVTLVCLEQNLGFGAGNKRGAQIANGRYLVLLNSDTVVETGWLEPLLAALKGDPEIGAACSTLRLLSRPGLINARGGGMTKLGYGVDNSFLYPWDHPWPPGPPGPRDVLFPTAAAMAMERDTFLSLGGFDPAMFMYHEDVDLGWRLWLLGHRVVVCPDSVVNHSFLGTSGQNQGLHWRAKMGLRHNVRSLLMHFELLNLGRALKGLIKVLWQERAFTLAWHVAAWNLRKLPDTLLRRRRMQQRRVRGDAELFDRGLISRMPMPPTPPERPVLPDGHRSPIQTPLLLPGEHSSLGRLGPGWFPTERIAGRKARWTTGRAAARLHVEPDRQGRLVAELFRPTNTGNDGPILLQANETEQEILIPSGCWTRAEVPCRSNSQGLIEVRVLSAEFACHDHWQVWDARQLGVAVHSLRFAPDGPRAPWVPASVAVIIPTYNRWEYLAETLEALCEQTRLPDEVLVVDDGSTDGTFDQLQAWRQRNRERLRLRVFHQENARQGAARNLALGHTEADLVLLLGDDMVPDPGCIAAHLDAHRELGAGVAVLGLIDWHERGVRVTPFLRYVHLDGAQFAFSHMKDGMDLPFTNFYTSNISVGRDLLGPNPFDPAFTSYGWEDIEIGWRLSLRGLRIVHHAAARVRHRHPMTLRGFLDRQRQVGGSIDTLYQLCPELQGNPWLPPPQPPRRWRLTRYFFPLLVPFLAVADRCRVPMPWKVYRELVHWAFYQGGWRHEPKAGKTVQ